MKQEEEVLPSIALAFGVATFKNPCAFMPGSTSIHKWREKARNWCEQMFTAIFS